MQKQERGNVWSGSYFEKVGSYEKGMQASDKNIIYIEIKKLGFRVAQKSMETRKVRS